MEGLLHKSTSYLRRSSPTILTCVSAVGVVATAVMAVKATPKAIILLEEAKDDKGEDLTKLEIVQTAGHVYIPAVLIGLSTITCIIGIKVLSKRNQASLASAYALLRESYQRYKKAANTIYGEDADSKIVAQMGKEVYVHADGYYVYSSNLDADSEKILCYDLFSKRYFTTTMAAVINAQYHINRNLCLRGYSNLNEFYEFLGIEKIDYGDEIGWSMDELIEGGIAWLDFDNCYTKMNDGMECCVISALNDPNKFYCD